MYMYVPGRYTNNDYYKYIYTTSLLQIFPQFYVIHNVHDIMAHIVITIVAPTKDKDKDKDKYKR